MAPHSFAAFAADGIRILTASADGTARPGALMASRSRFCKDHTDKVNSAQLSADGGYILTTSDDATARLWDREGKALADASRAMQDWSTMRYSRLTGTVSLTASFDKTARLWDRNPKRQVTLQVTAAPVKARFLPGDRRILTASDDATARLWEDDGELVATPRGHTGPITSAGFGTQMSAILTASVDGTARLWDRDGRPCNVAGPH